MNFHARNSITILIINIRWRSERHCGRGGLNPHSVNVRGLFGVEPPFLVLITAFARSTRSANRSNRVGTATAHCAITESNSVRVETELSTLSGTKFEHVTLRKKSGIESHYSELEIKLRRGEASRTRRH